MNRYEGVMGMATAMRELQRKYHVEVLTATVLLPHKLDGFENVEGGEDMTLRITGVEDPTCEIVDSSGRAFRFHFAVEYEQ